MAVKQNNVKTQSAKVVSSHQWLRAFLPALLMLHSSATLATTEAQSHGDSHSDDNPDYFLNLEYKNFYTHLRKLDPEALPHLHFAFGFILPKSQASCEIDNVYIHTPKIDIPVEVTEGLRFNLPRERALKLADAEVHIRFTPESLQNYHVSADACNLSVRLEAKLPEQVAMQPDQLQSLNHEFKVFFDKMGAGLFSFMMPQPQGVKLHLKSDYASQHSHGIFQGMNISNGMVFLEDNWIHTNQDNLDLSHVSHITAWVDNE